MWSRTVSEPSSAQASGTDDLQPEWNTEPSVRQRRQRWVIGLAVGTAVLSLAGLVASYWIKSPAQVAAETAPPPPSIITAPVSSQVLRDTVVFRGTFMSAGTVTFTPTEAVSPSGSGPASPDLVVSSVLARVGQRVQPGEVLVNVSDRPVFVLKGSVPAFRDMTQGEAGGDIEELQAALAYMGYGSGADAAGVFGPGTARAVRAFYAAIGYPVPVVPGEAQQPSANSGTTATVTSPAPPSPSANGTPAASTAPTATTAPTSTPKPQPPRAQTPAWMVEVPMSEAMFIPSFPATVTSLPRLGATVAAPLIQLREGGLRLTGKLDPEQGAQVRAGMRVHVLSNLTGQQALGVISSVGQVVKSGNGQAPYLPVHISPSRSWAASWSGQDVQLSVTSAASSGPVLAVPEAAITASADAVTSVTVLEPGGKTRSVRVRTGLSADGMVAVTPISGNLQAGEQVVVGG